MRQRSLIQGKDDILAKVAEYLDSLPKDGRVHIKIKRLERKGSYRLTVVSHVDSTHDKRP